MNKNWSFGTHNTNIHKYPPVDDCLTQDINSDGLIGKFITAEVECVHPLSWRFSLPFTQNWIWVDFSMRELFFIAVCKITIVDFWGPLDAPPEVCWKLKYVP